MQKGWDASRYLPALLAARGMTQEQLGLAAGIDRGQINGYCTGRIDLGIKNARRIAAVLEVSLLELGGTAEEDDARAMTILDRLAEVETEAKRDVVVLRRDLNRAIERIRALEKRARAADQPATEMPS